jgi:hypothetical protein
MSRHPTQQMMQPRPFSMAGSLHSLQPLPSCLPEGAKLSFWEQFYCWYLAMVYVMSRQPQQQMMQTRPFSLAEALLSLQPLPSCLPEGAVQLSYSKLATV